MKNYSDFRYLVRTWILVFIIPLLLSASFRESDPLKVLWSFVFPDKSDFSAVHLPLRPLRDSNDLNGLLAGPNQLFLLRHGRAETQSLFIIQDPGPDQMPSLYFGTLGNLAIPKLGSTKLLDPLILLETDLPPESLFALVTGPIAFNGSGSPAKMVAMAVKPLP